jgi:hypothetical protein
MDVGYNLMLILNDNFWRAELGSQFGRLCINRNRAEGHARIMWDYFSLGAIYTDKQLSGAVSDAKGLVPHNRKAAVDQDDWFKLRKNACGEMSASPIMECVVAIRVLAYCCSADVIDNYVCIEHDTILEAMRRFYKAVIEIFGPRYLRALNEDDTL